MKRKIRVLFATVLSILMMASTVVAIVPSVVGATATDTSTPAYLFDFTTAAIQNAIERTEQMTVSPEDGYTTFTATGSDPQTWLETPTCPPNKARYVAIYYRTSATCKGEFLCTRSDNGVMGSDGTHQQWEWISSGEWETLVASMDAWKLAKDSVTFSSFRIDPLEGDVSVGDSIDIKYIAFFASKSDANRFDYEVYLAERRIEWPEPSYTEMETCAEDNYEGTLQYTTSEDGKTVTISYEINGETLSHTVPNNNNYLFGGYAGTDDLNRPLYDSNQVGVYQDGKRYVGLFYFLFQGEHGDEGIYNLQQIIDEVGLPAAGKLSCGKYGPLYSDHFFAEPLYGYYYANDAWVLRKHAELLTMANIDFLFFDVTNGYSYKHNALKLMEILHELNEQGFDAPQVVFYTNTNAAAVVKDVYDSIYKKNLYPDTWFCLDGKPVIVAPYSANIDDFFTIQQNQWPRWVPTSELFKENGWPWMDFDWPQRVFLDENGEPNAINVSVAQHSGPRTIFSLSSLYGNTTNRGRSFTMIGSTMDESLQLSYEAWQNNPELTNYGLNFQAQWDYALSTDAPIILVTGWNEWIAARQNQPSDGEVIFIDTASMEFSRDTEMMRGGYFDNYYMQLIYNVQRAKGAAPVVVQDSRKAVNVTGSFDQWNDVTVTYTDATGDTVDRNATGYGQTSYTNTSGRNDIESAKVTSDTKNLYFYIKTVEDITMYHTDSSWMQLYLNVDGRDAEAGETGWYGYDFVVNYQAKDAFTTTVAKYNGTDGAYGFTSVGEVNYRAKGNEMMIAVPLSMLGIENYKAIDLEFKWADSLTCYDEMEDFYCDGDMAPLGRLNYVYQNYIPGVNDPEIETESTTDTEMETEIITDTETSIVMDTETETVADVVTEAVTDPVVTETEAETANDADGDTTTRATPAESGCKSALGFAAIPVMLALSGVALGCRKRKEN